MKIDRAPRRLTMKAAEMVGSPEFQSEAWFDPSRDFDANVKQRVLEDVLDPESGWDFSAAGIEYFVALFPNEFKGPLSASVEPYIQEEINNFKEEKYRISLDWESPVAAAMRVKLAFPEKAQFIRIPDFVRKIADTETWTGVDFLKRDLLLFLRIFVLGEREDREKEWEKLKEQLRLMEKAVLSVGIKAKKIAQAKLLFPEKDFSDFISESFKQEILSQLQAFRSATLAGEDLVLALNDTYYAELAWAATILSADEVGIRSNGEIYVVSSKAKLGNKKKLPERPQV